MALGIGLPLFVVRFIRNRRKAAFSTQLPDALDVVVRSLRSGHPVPTALTLVGREMPDPIGTEFGLTTDELTYGIDLPRALQNLSARVGVPDMSLLVTAVSLQSSAGGNLGEVLENLSRILRDRFQLKRKVRSLSAEGRFSAYGLTILADRHRARRSTFRIRATTWTSGMIRSSSWSWAGSSSGRSSVT